MAAYDLPLSMKSPLLASAMSGFPERPVLSRPEAPRTSIDVVERDGWSYVEITARSWDDLRGPRATEHGKRQFQILKDALRKDGICFVHAPHLSSADFKTDPIFWHGIAADGYKIATDGEDTPVPVAEKPDPRLVHDHHGAGKPRYVQRSASQQLCDSAGKGVLRDFIGPSGLDAKVWINHHDQDTITYLMLLRRLSALLKQSGTPDIAAIEQQFRDTEGLLYKGVQAQGHQDVWGGAGKNATLEMREHLAAIFQPYQESLPTLRTMSAPEIADMLDACIRGWEEFIAGRGKRNALDERYQLQGKSDGRWLLASSHIRDTQGARHPMKPEARVAIHQNEGELLAVFHKGSGQGMHAYSIMDWYDPDKQSEASARKPLDMSFVYELLNYAERCMEQEQLSPNELCAKVSRYARGVRKTLSISPWGGNEVGGSGHGFESRISPDCMVKLVDTIERLARAEQSNQRCLDLTVQRRGKIQDLLRQRPTLLSARSWQSRPG